MTENARSTTDPVLDACQLVNVADLGLRDLAALPDSALKTALRRILQPDELDNFVVAFNSLI